MLRDRLGVEVQHDRVAGRCFTPAATVRETSWFGARDLTISGSADDLPSAFAVREFSRHDERAKFYLAANGGYRRWESVVGRGSVRRERESLAEIVDKIDQLDETPVPEPSRS